MIADDNYIINLKLTNAGLSLKQLTDGDNSEIYKAYRECGGFHMESPSDTHYVMDNSYVVFIGNKHELLGFAHQQA
jgi:hypothetical protein